MAPGGQRELRMDEEHIEKACAGQFARLAEAAARGSE
jgi:hypothetical protein